MDAVIVEYKFILLVVNILVFKLLIPVKGLGGREAVVVAQNALQKRSCLLGGWEARSRHGGVEGMPARLARTQKRGKHRGGLLVLAFGTRFYIPIAWTRASRETEIKRESSKETAIRRSKQCNATPGDKGKEIDGGSCGP